jgi:predicted nucleic acid-binding protein
MSYLLDTCVISELRKVTPLHVKDWFESKDEELFFISVVTIAELLDGIERLPSSKKKNDLKEWFHGSVLSRFKDRILVIDEKTAKMWAHLNANLIKKGVTVGIQDLYIAATAMVNSLAVVTLNLKDFKNTNISIFNPWELN